MLGYTYEQVAMDLAEKRDTSMFYIPLTNKNSNN